MPHYIVVPTNNFVNYIKFSDWAYQYSPNIIVQYFTVDCFKTDCGFLLKFKAVLNSVIKENA